MPYPWKTFKRAVADKLFGKTKNTALDVQVEQLADAREGIIYFLGNVRAEPEPKRDFGLIGGAFSNFVVDPTAIGDLKNASLAIVNSAGPGRQVVESAERAAAAVKSALRPVVDLIRRFFERMFAKLQEVYGLTDGMESMAEYALWATSTLTKTLADAIPGWGYVQDAADIYAGVKQGATGAWRFFEQLHSGWGVELLGGHPSIIANALSRHSLAMLAGGLKDVGIAAGKVAASAAADASSGTGTLVAVITGILQRIGALVARYIQRFRVEKVLYDAKMAWRLRGFDGALINDHAAFSKWFQKSVIVTPIIAALTLGSGVAGNPMRFLQLIKTDDAVISQAEFDKGVDHIEKLKSLSGRYAAEYKDNYQTRFVSADDYVQSRLDLLIKGARTIVIEPEIQWVQNPLYQG